MLSEAHHVRFSDAWSRDAILVLLRLPYTGTFCPFDVMAKGCAGGIMKVEVSLRTVSLLIQMTSHV